jgi:hypothetical protein
MCPRCGIAAQTELSENIAVRNSYAGHLERLCCVTRRSSFRINSLKYFLKEILANPDA